MSIKEEIGREIVPDLPRSGTIAFGSGTTVNAIISQIATELDQFSDVDFISGSSLTSQTMKYYGVPETVNVDHIDLCIDGADQVLAENPHFILKGRGGALFREKVLWHMADEIIIGITDNKLVKELTMTVPVEIDPYARWITEQQILKLFSTASIKLRSQNDGFVFYTDGGNIILDVKYKQLDKPVLLHQSLKSITGVIETGLFTDFDQTKITSYIGTDTGDIETMTFSL